MFQKMLYDWFFKGLEIVGAAFFGYWIYLILLGLTGAHFWAVTGLTLIFYFFSPIIKPYIDNFRNWIYKKVTGEDE